MYRTLLSTSGLSYKFRLQAHGAETVYFAVNIMVTVSQADVFHLSTGLDRLPGLNG